MLKGDETVVTTAAENGALTAMLGGSPAAPVVVVMRGKNADVPPLLTEDWTARATTRLASVGVMPAGRVMPSACTTSGGGDRLCRCCCRDHCGCGQHKNDHEYASRRHFTDLVHSILPFQCRVTQEHAGQGRRPAYAWKRLRAPRCEFVSRYDAL